MRHRSDCTLGGAIEITFVFVFVFAVSVCVDQQFETNSYRICKVWTLGNSLSVGLRTGYSSVCTEGGTAEGTPLYCHRQANTVEQSA